jgi:hypothetical protein
MTNNNGFWIGWLDLLALLLQLQSIITAHNRWLPKTRSIPYWTTVFSSTVTDLILIYKSVTSSASVVCWLTLHSWTLSHDCNLTDLRMNWLTTPVRPTWMMTLLRMPSYKPITCPFIPWCGPNREHYLKQFICCILCTRCYGYVFLASFCLAMNYYGFQVSCHNINIPKVGTQISSAEMREEWLQWLSHVKITYRTWTPREALELSAKGRRLGIKAANSLTNMQMPIYMCYKSWEQLPITWLFCQQILLIKSMSWISGNTAM